MDRCSRNAFAPADVAADRLPASYLTRVVLSAPAKFRSGFPNAIADPAAPGAINHEFD
jgi:hypothetical protein